MLGSYLAYDLGTENVGYSRDVGLCKAGKALSYEKRDNDGLT